MIFWEYLNRIFQKEEEGRWSSFGVRTEPAGGRRINRGISNTPGAPSGQRARGSVNVGEDVRSFFRSDSPF